MQVQNGSVVFDNGFKITLHRTIRLPEDGNSHSLPPSRGQFAMKRIQDYRDRVPAAWRDHGGVFIPMYEREALWLGFSGPTSAVKIATGKVNAVSGGEWSQELKEPTGVDGKDPEQDYMVGPDPQRWLDGFNVGGGQIRQFVAMQMGKGYTVEAQVTGREDVGGIQILVVPAKPGAIKPVNRSYGRGMATLSSGGGLESMGGEESFGSYAYESAATMDSFGGGLLGGGATRSMSTNSSGRSVQRKGAQMGLAQGGRMEQKVYADPHGIDTWDQGNAERIFVHLVDATLWETITGEPCPPCPIPASEYKGAYFTHDTGAKAVNGSGTLAGVKPVSQKDNEHGFAGQQDDSALFEKKTNKIIALAVPKNKINDGNW